MGEDVHVAARVAAAGHGGQVLVSAATAALVAEPLRELGEHRLKDIAAPVALFQLGDGSFPPLRTLATSNLPRPASSFVGRERELEAVLARIAGGARLLTLTGPGGSGKTRLALEAGAALVTDFRAGAVWVGLASLRDPALVGETIARAVGAPQRPRRAHRRARAAPAPRRQLRAGRRRGARAVRRSSPRARTSPSSSRAASACASTARSSSPSRRSPPPRRSRCSASGRSSSRPTRSPSSAGGSTRSRSPWSWPPRARRRSRPRRSSSGSAPGLDLLRGGRDADPRQATLRATIAWSHDLLSDGERRLFRRLSVFAGGCTLEAAEQVADADLDTLQSLVEKSLLRFSNERYSMLETIREFAAEQLDPQEGEELRARHRCVRRRPRRGERPFAPHRGRGGRCPHGSTPTTRTCARPSRTPSPRREPDDAGADPRRALPVPHLARPPGRGARLGRGGARRPRAAVGSRPRRDARRRRRDRAVRGSARAGDRAQGGAGCAAGRRRARRAAAQSEGGDARRPLRDRARPGRPRACARVRGGERRGGRRRAGATCASRSSRSGPAIWPRRSRRASRRSPAWRRGRSTTRAPSSCSARRPAAPATPGPPTSASPKGSWSSPRSATAAGSPTASTVSPALAVGRRPRARGSPPRRRRADPGDARAPADPDRRPVPGRSRDAGRDLTLDEAVAYALSATAEAGDR